MGNSAISKRWGLGEKRNSVQIGDRHFLNANRETSGTSRHKAMFHICLLRAARSTDVTVLLISHAAFSYPRQYPFHLLCLTHMVTSQNPLVANPSTIPLVVPSWIQPPIARLLCVIRLHILGFKIFSDPEASATPSLVAPSR